MVLDDLPQKRHLFIVPTAMHWSAPRQFWTLQILVTFCSFSRLHVIVLLMCIFLVVKEVEQLLQFIVFLCFLFVSFSLISLERVKRCFGLDWMLSGRESGSMIGCLNYSREKGRLEQA